MSMKLDADEKSNEIKSVVTKDTVIKIENQKEEENDGGEEEGIDELEKKF